MQQHQKIYVAGHRGMVGSALVRKLQALGYTNIVTRSSAELDLRNQAAVQSFFKEEQPAFVFMAAAKVGGIHANNTFRADFIYDNLMMEANVIHAAYQYQVEKLLLKILMELLSSLTYKFITKLYQKDDLLFYVNM